MQLHTRPVYGTVSSNWRKWYEVQLAWIGDGVVIPAGVDAHVADVGDGRQLLEVT